MNIGMLWQDGDEKQDLEAKVARAADHYRRKFGQQPDICFVHPTLASEPTTKAGVAVRPSRTVMRGLLWIGMKDSE